MNLHEAIVFGKFCGLNTVNECIANIELHYWHLLPELEAASIRKEFYKEVKKYEKGELVLDWDLISRKVAEQEKEFESWEKEHESIDNLEFFNGL